MIDGAWAGSTQGRQLHCTDLVRDLEQVSERVVPLLDECLPRSVAVVGALDHRGGRGLAGDPGERSVR